MGEPIPINPHSEAIRSRTQETRAYLDGNPDAPDRPIKAMDMAKFKFAEGNLPHAQGWAEKVIDKVTETPTLPETDNHYKIAAADAHLVIGAIEATQALTQTPPDFTQMYSNFARTEELLPNRPGIRLFTRIPLEELKIMAKNEDSVTGEKGFDKQLVDLAIAYRERIQSDPTLFLVSLRGDISPFPQEGRETAAAAIEQFITVDASRLGLPEEQATELAANFLLWTQRVQTANLHPQENPLTYLIKTNYGMASLHDPKFADMDPYAFDVFAGQQANLLYQFLNTGVDPYFNILSLNPPQIVNEKLQPLITLCKAVEDLPLRTPLNAFNQTAQTEAFINSAHRLLGMSPEHARSLITDIDGWRQRDHSHEPVNDDVQNNIISAFLELNQREGPLTQDEQTFIDDISRFAAAHPQDPYGLTDQALYYRGLIEGFESVFYEDFVVPYREAQRAHRYFHPPARPQERQATYEPTIVGEPDYVWTTTIREGQPVDDPNRREILQKAFGFKTPTDFKPDELYVTLEDTKVGREKRLRLLIGGNIFHLEPAEPGFYAIDTAFDKEDAFEILGDLLQGGTPADNILDQLLRRRPATDEEQFTPNFAINPITNPADHIKARGIFWNTAHSIQASLLGAFTDHQQERIAQRKQQAIDDELEAMADGLVLPDTPEETAADKRVKKAQQAGRDRTGKHKRKRVKLGKGGKDHVNWVQDLVNLPDETVNERLAREEREARTKTALDAAEAAARATAQAQQPVEVS